MIIYYIYITVSVIIAASGFITMPWQLWFNPLTLLYYSVRPLGSFNWYYLWLNDIIFHWYRLETRFIFTKASEIITDISYIPWDICCILYCNFIKVCFCDLTFVLSFNSVFQTHVFMSNSYQYYQNMFKGRMCACHLA